MAEHNIFGSSGENIACDYLENKGHEILERNWRFLKAEIDIITLHSSRLIFIEVKTRSGIGFGDPQDFVHKTKQNLIASGAKEYIFRKNHIGEVRFDVISVLFDKFGEYQIDHIEDAFWP